MTISLQNIGKRFNGQWVFRNLSYEFESQNKYSVLGVNGSGKSTLLQLIAGNLSPTEGRLCLTLSKGEGSSGRAGKKGEERCFQYLALAAPYMELFEEMTFAEAVRFQGRFKPFISSLKPDDVIMLSGLGTAKDKEIRNFSSGMKQRARLALAVLSDTPLLLLDEPCTNLDEQGVQWYRKLIDDYAEGKLVIVCSNYNRKEYEFCTKELVLEPETVTTQHLPSKS